MTQPYEGPLVTKQAEQLIRHKQYTKQFHCEAG